MELYLSRQTAHLVLSSLLVVLTGCEAGKSTTARPQHQQDKPLLKIDEQSLNFGEVYSTDRFVRNIRIQNISPHPVHVEELAGDCQCLSLAPSQFELGIGAEREVEAKFDLRKNSSAGLEYEFSAGLFANVAERSKVQHWTFSGRVVEVLAEGSTPLSFEFAYDGSPKDSGYSERNLRFPVTDLNVSVEPPVVDVEYGLSGDVIQFLSSDTGSCPPGRTKATVRLSGISPEGKDISVAIPCVIHKEFSYSSIPSVVNFGSIPAGTATEQNVHINFRELCRKFRPAGAGSDSEITVVSHPEASDITSLTVQLRLEHAQPGFHSGSIAYLAEFSEKDEVVEMKIPYSYYGLRRKRID